MTAAPDPTPSPRLAELARHGRTAWRLLVDPRVPLRHKLIPVVTALYLLSPLDLVPEAVAGPLGLVDDIVVVLLALRAFNHLAAPYAAGSRRPGDDPPPDGPTIDVPYRVE